VPLTQSTKSAIKTHLLKEVRRYLSEGNHAKNKVITTRPFQSRLLPELFAGGLSQQSFSTRLGSWFQVIGRLVAIQFHQSAQIGYSVSGEIQPAASSHITTLLDQMNKGRPKRVPSRQEDITQVLAVQSLGGVPIEVTADLFVRTHENEELYFEMKTPEPNKDTSMAMKRFILTTAAIRKGHMANAYAATAYNPYGDGKPYVRNYAQQFLEIGQDMLIGRTFWEKIGDLQTYDELLILAEEVGKEAAL
jgi:hypothetical protein